MRAVSARLPLARSTQHPLSDRHSGQRRRGALCALEGGVRRGRSRSALPAVTGGMIARPHQWTASKHSEFSACRQRQGRRRSRRLTEILLRSGILTDSERTRGSERRPKRRSRGITKPTRRWKLVRRAAEAPLPGLRDQIRHPALSRDLRRRHHHHRVLSRHRQHRQRSRWRRRQHRCLASSAECPRRSLLGHMFPQDSFS